MILNTAVKSVKRESHRGDQAVTTDQITTDIIGCVNKAIRDLYKLLPKRFLWKQGTISVTLGVAGTPAVYSLASDVQEPIIFHYTSSSLRILDKVTSDRDWIKGVWNPTTSVNKPQVYREIGPNSSTGYKQIELFPIPDASYTVNYEYYRTKGDDLSTSDLATEIPIFPDLYQDAIEKGALYYFLKGFDDVAQGMAMADFEKAKLALNIGDEEDKDADVAFGFGQGYQREPGFRQ
jgi:hypothetical protein